MQKKKKMLKIYQQSSWKYKKTILKIMHLTNKEIIFKDNVDFQSLYSEN
jgi:hypothetical protein